MVQHKKFPKLQGKFVRWVNDTEFVVLIGATEVLAHKDYWEGDIPAKSEETKSRIMMDTEQIIESTRNPVEIAYELLVAYRDANMIPDMGTIEEIIGYLGEALA